MKHLIYALLIFLLHYYSYSQDPIAEIDGIVKAKELQLFDSNGDLRFKINADSGSFEMIKEDTLWYALTVASPITEYTTDYSYFADSGPQTLINFTDVHLGENLDPNRYAGRDVIFAAEDDLLLGNHERFHLYYPGGSDPPEFRSYSNDYDDATGMTLISQGIDFETGTEFFLQAPTGPSGPPGTLRFNAHGNSAWAEFNDYLNEHRAEASPLGFKVEDLGNGNSVEVGPSGVKVEDSENGPKLNMYPIELEFEWGDGTKFKIYHDFELDIWHWGPETGDNWIEIPDGSAHFGADVEVMETLSANTMRATNTLQTDNIESENGNGILLFGDLFVTGNLSKFSGSFKIDHPQDPYNKYLYHSFVESPDMMNVYNGNITTDEAGKAVVILPDYFESLNIDFRYQLTVIGKFAQAIVAEEIENNQFEIMTDEPNVKVSWQVTGIRNDAYARDNRIQVEVDKKGDEVGLRMYDPNRISMVSNDR